MYANIVQALDHYYLAKQRQDVKEQLDIADELVTKWIPNIMQGTSEATTEAEIEAEEATLG